MVAGRIVRRVFLIRRVGVLVGVNIAVVTVDVHVMLVLVLMRLVRVAEPMHHADRHESGD